MLKLFLIALFLQVAEAPKKAPNLSDTTLKEWYKTAGLAASHYASYLEQQNRDREAIATIRKKMAAECADLKMVLLEVGDPTCIDKQPETK